MRPTPTPTPAPVVHYSEELLLEVASPADNSVVSSQRVSLEGRASPDATVSVNGQLVGLEATGHFSVSVPLNEGPNLIEIIASDFAGNVAQKLLTLTSANSGQGLFGAVTNITTVSPGIIRISLDTTSEGVQRVQTTPNTVFEVPGKDPATASNISVDDFLALWVEESDSILEAKSILVRPPGAVIHAHVTGSSVQADVGQAGIMDRDGNLITVDPDPPNQVLEPGQLVTALVRQNLQTGRLTLLGAESADAKADRLERALQTATATDSQSNLEERLRSNVTGIVTSLQEIGNRVDPRLNALVFVPFLEHSRSRYDGILTALGLGTHTVEVTGVMEEVDPDGSLVFASPLEGPSVELNVTDETEISVFGRAARIQNLKIGHQIEAIHDPGTGQAMSIDVFFPSLRQDLISSLLLQAQDTQISGVIIQADASSLVIRLASGEIVDLTVTPDTAIKVEGEPVSLSGLYRVLPVTAVYDPATTNILTIDQNDGRPGQDFLSGVVTSFIPKIQPGIIIPGSDEVGNLLISTIDGGVITLSITDATIIEVEGERLSIDAVKVGDLVRPASRYDGGTGQVQRLVLNAPSFRGTIRGRYTSPGGRNYLTISTDDLKLVTVIVSQDTLILKGNEPTDFAALEPGEQIVSGLYDPLSLRASQLDVRPPKTVQQSGVVAAIDATRGIVTIAPDVGDQVTLLVPNKPGIVFVDGDSASVEEVRVGDLVELVFYSPENKIVVRIVISSQ